MYLLWEIVLEKTTTCAAPMKEKVQQRVYCAGPGMSHLAVRVRVNASVIGERNRAANDGVSFFLGVSFGGSGEAWQCGVIV